MSEPSKGTQTQSKLSIRSVAGGFIVSWEVPAVHPGGLLAQAQMSVAGAMDGYENPCVNTAERVCSGLPALLSFIGETIKVQP